MISFDFASVATWPSTSRQSAAQALTRCSGDVLPAVSKDRRNVLPSIAITLRRRGKALHEVTEARLELRGSSIRKTRLNVSWLGMP